MGFKVSANSANIFSNYGATNSIKKDVPLNSTFDNYAKGPLGNVGHKQANPEESGRSLMNRYLGID